jgi:hypothetical protein
MLIVMRMGGMDVMGICIPPRFIAICVFISMTAFWLAPATKR